MNYLANRFLIKNPMTFSYYKEGHLILSWKQQIIQDFALGVLEYQKNLEKKALGLNHEVCIVEID